LTGIPVRSVNDIFLKRQGKVDLATVIHSDGWRGYDGLADLGFDKHFRVNYRNDEFAPGERHINGIESFWSYAKRRLTKWQRPSSYTLRKPSSALIINMATCTWNS
jgi:hypothetical protein